MQQRNQTKIQVVFFSLVLLVFPAACFASCPDGNGNYDAYNQQAILDAHNLALRSPIAKGTFTAKDKQMPSATNMREMVWNCTLEKSAQDYANKCVFAHSGGDYGENLFESWGSGSAPGISGSGKQASEAWANEFQTQGWPSILFDGQAMFIGHATQMAWWSSDNIGCGAAQCDDGSKKFLLVVCQYSPPGNVVPENNYEEGPTCSNCGSGYSCDSSTGLCKK